MNEIIKFLKKRRSVTAKKMIPGKVTESDLNDILECALRVPDHGALSPWKLVVIQNDMRKTIGEEILVPEFKKINDDFNEENINIGDQFKVNECLLQVSQPRIPCYKIGIKLNNRDFPKMFSQSGLLGSYLRVIHEGEINTGDEIHKVHSEENSMSLKDIAHLLFVDVKNIELMKKALDIKPLTEEIKEKFRERLMKLGDFSSL